MLRRWGDLLLYLDKVPTADARQEPQGPISPAPDLHTMDEDARTGVDPLQHGNDPALALVRAAVTQDDQGVCLKLLNVYSALR